MTSTGNENPRGGLLRVGSVPFLVARPLDAGLEAEPGIEVDRRVPARLVEGLRSGELEVALVSSIELFRRPGYAYLDGLGVAGEGHVGSVQLFLRRPVEELRSVALDPASRAAAALVQVVLAARGVRPEFLTLPLGADPREAEADAWLRIGDAALREHLAPDSPPVFNPSEAWSELTGLPFVFATWIVRPGVEPGPRVEAFWRSRERGASVSHGLALDAAREWRIEARDAEHYLLHECLYEPGERMRRILFEFRDRAAALGLCEPDLEPAAIGRESATV